MKKLIAIVLCTALVWTSGSMQLCAAAVTPEDSSPVSETAEVPGVVSEEEQLTEEEQVQPETEETQPKEEDPEEPGEETPGTEETQPGTEEEQPKEEDPELGEEAPGTEESQPEEEMPGTEEGEPEDSGTPEESEESPTDPAPMPDPEPEEPSEELEEPSEEIEEIPEEEQIPSEEEAVPGIGKPSGDEGATGGREDLSDELLDELNEKAKLERMGTVGAAGSGMEAEPQGALVPKEVDAKKNCSAKALVDLLELNAEGKYQLTINIPAGTYKMDRSLYIYPNTTIKADPEAHFIRENEEGAMIETKLTKGANGYDGSGYNGNYNITIDGGIWDSYKWMNKNQGQETFRFIHSQNIVVKNATLCNVPEGSHLIVLAGVKDVTITKCTFYGYGDNGDNEITPKEAVQLDTVHSVQEVPTGQTGDIVWDDLPCDNIKITNCKFRDFSRGIGSHTAVNGRFHTNVRIESNTFTKLSDSAIRLYNYKDTVVTKNKIDGTEEGILAYTYMEEAEENSFFQPNNKKVGTLPANYKITISNNEIKNIKDTDKVWGDAIRVVGKKGRRLNGVTISGNKITTASRYGIFATTAKVKINGNTIASTTGHGILLEKECNDSEIYSNNITKSKEGGIAAYDSDRVTIYSNKVSAAKDGIYLLDSEKCTVGKDSKTGNEVTSSKENGITLSTNDKKGATGSTGTKVQYNTIKSAKKNGIFVYKTKNAVINKNTVTKAEEESGILITTSSNSAKVSSNTVKTAGQNGISITLSSKYAQVTGNKILKYGTKNINGKRYGIMVFKSSGSSKKNAQISKNEITGTGKSKKKNGIQLSESSYVTVSGNKVTNADGVGIYAYKAKSCTIGVGSKDYNTVKDPTEQGIYLTTSCDSSKVLYNKVSGVKVDGIGVYSSPKVTVSRNTVSAKGNGIYFTTKCTSGKISNNTINSAGGHGIGVATNSKSMTISGNTIKKYSTSKSKAYGIYVYQSGGKSSKSRTEVKDNKITGTGKSTRKDGIKASEAAYTTIEKNTITTPAGAGVYLYKSKNCVINKNTIKSPNSYGITVTTSCDKAKVTSNNISKPKNVAINLYKAPSSTVSSNTITTTKKYRGIWVSTSNKTNITSNKIKGTSKSNAIVVTSSSGCKKSKNKIS